MRLDELRNSLPWVRRARELKAREEQLDSLARKLAARESDLRKQADTLEAMKAKLGAREAKLSQRDAAELQAPWRTRDYFARGLAKNIEGIPDARCFVLQNVLRSLRAIPGDVAECGVRYGKSTVFMLEADEASRRFHLFDSFEGLSKPGPQDNLAADGRPFWEAHQLAVGEDVVRETLAPYSNVQFYRGWIPDRFPEVSDRSFALVHVDVDLYEPTLDTLRFFWPRMAAGGIVLCDDYGSPRCPGAKRALDEFFEQERVAFAELPTMQAFAMKHA
jgi:O-methyltransferase